MNERQYQNVRRFLNNSYEKNLKETLNQKITKR